MKKLERVQFEWPLFTLQLKQGLCTWGTFDCKELQGEDLQYMCWSEIRDRTKFKNEYQCNIWLESSYDFRRVKAFFELTRTVISWRAGHTGFPDTKWATTESLFEDVSPSTAFSISQLDIEQEFSGYKGKKRNENGVRRVVSYTEYG